MHLATPRSRLRRGVRRLALTICALILGAGFTPALPSTMESSTAAAVSFTAAAARAPESTVDEPAAAPGFAAAVEAPPALDTAFVLTGRPVSPAAGRAPPLHPA
jgi:hypothetical protein